MAEKKDVIVRPRPEGSAEIMAKHGVVKDANGKIVRSKGWKKERIAHLEKKIEDFATRTKNAKAEIKELSK